jgi:hypothetical protein
MTLTFRSGILSRSAEQAITIVDSYIDSSILTLLGTCKRALDVQLLTHALPNDFLHEVGAFKAQHGPRLVEVRRTGEFHDRFIVVDNSRCFHVGASIKDAGRRAFMINQVQDGCQRSGSPKANSACLGWRGPSTAPGKVSNTGGWLTNS